MEQSIKISIGSIYAEYGGQPMYLQSVSINNFRCFGEIQTIQFKKGLNVLIGENDSGKSAVVDAIRIALGTTDQSWYRIEPSDFHKEEQHREIKIVLKFCDLSDDEQAAFLECLSYETDNEINTPCLYVHWVCKYLLNFTPHRTSVTLTTGYYGDGPALPSAARELLRVTYLRPLRDAYSNMQAGRNSRLSQVIQGIPNLDDGESEYMPGMDLSKLSITGIANLSNALLAKHPKLKKANDDIGMIISSKMLLKGDNVKTQFEVAGTNATDSKKIIALLEKLDLAARTLNDAGRVGLGTSNILSMACELLLNRSSGSSFLLIEEPEAHIHAQRQLRLIQSLQDEASSIDHNQQIIVTTHSPILASVINLKNITIIKEAKAYSLEQKYTKLDKSDYKFLERYLDATKANLFFAKAVIMVEGPSEELLLPTIARLLGKDLTEYGVSVVNVRGTGLRRFARIFQRKDCSIPLNIKVACITDRDVMPDCGPEICINTEYVDRSKWPKNRKWKVESDFSSQSEKEDYIKKLKRRADGQLVKTFIADYWTFEYDLAYAGLLDELVEAIVNIKYIEDNRETKKKKIVDKLSAYSTKQEKASYIYHFFADGSTSKAEVAQQVAEILEEKYSNRTEELEDKLPQYLKCAINYVT